jgi:hypothetical protein
MRKLFIILAIIFFSFISLSACNIGVSKEESEAKNIDKTQETNIVESSNTIPLCEINQEMVGGSIRSTGKIILVEEDNPDGKFAIIEDDGCQIGIFVTLNIWNRWDPDIQNLFRSGAIINVWGKLVSFDEQLIIDLEGLAEADIPKENQKTTSVVNGISNTNKDILELPEAPESKMIETPLLYSGSNNIPGLCYLGAAGMLVKKEHQELDFRDIIALSGVGSSALHLNFPEMPSMLISAYTDQSIVFMIKNLNAEYALGYLTGGIGSDSFQPAELPFERNASNLILFESKEIAYETLKRAVGSGKPVLVYLNLYYVYDDFAEISKYWLESLGKDQASHYLVVKGYDKENIYFNDPTDPTEAAGILSTDVDNFLQAWEMTNIIDNAPPLGPCWMLFLTESGTVPNIDKVIAINLKKAIDAPTEMRKFAEQTDNSDYTLFLILELGNARTKFGEYLIENKLTAAGEFYIQSGNLLIDMVTNREINTEKMLEAADLEESAIKLLNNQ